MNDEQPHATATSAFLTDLSRLILGSDRKQRQISRDSGIPRSTVSDYVHVRRTQVPRRELLAALLEACGQDLAQIESWEERRIAVLRGGPEQPPADDQIDQLSERLEQALSTIDALRAKEHDVQERMTRADREKVSLTGELDRLRTTNSQAHTQIGKLTMLLSARTQEAEQLRSMLSIVIERRHTAEVVAANLRAELSQLEVDVLFERVSIGSSTGGSGSVRHRPASTRGSSGGQGSAVTGLQGALDSQIGRTEATRAGLAEALTELEAVRAELARILDGSSADVLHALDDAMERSCAELTSATSIGAHFLDQARQVALGAGRILIISAETQRCAEITSGLLSAVRESQKEVEALMDNNTGYGQLLEMISVLVLRLDSCQALSLQAVQLVEEYRSSL